MEFTELERLGLNKNESKVYFALINKGQATASEMVKLLGIHRNIVYDNLEKLIDKGLVSYIIEGTKKKFIAEEPQAILDFLRGKKDQIDKELSIAERFLPEIKKILAANKKSQDASLFRGVKSIKKILHEVLNSKEYWVIGVSNDSVEIMGETFWANFNARRSKNKIKEHLLFNSNFRNVVNIKPSAMSLSRILPPELTQATEIMIFDKKVAIIVYTFEPIGLLIDSEEVYNTFKKQFEFLWNLAKR